MHREADEEGISSRITTEENVARCVPGRRESSTDQNYAAVAVCLSSSTLNRELFGDTHHQVLGAPDDAGGEQRVKGDARHAYPSNQRAGRPSEPSRWEVLKMGRPIVIALYVIVMVATIVGVDVAFFRDYFWARLAANVGLVLLFGAFYVRFAAGS